MSLFFVSMFVFLASIQYKNVGKLACNNAPHSLYAMLRGKLSETDCAHSGTQHCEEELKEWNGTFMYID